MNRLPKIGKGREHALAAFAFLEKCSYSFGVDFFPAAFFDADSFAAALPSFVPSGMLAVSTVR